MALDTSIALKGVPLQLDNPMDSAAKALTIRQLMAQGEATQAKAQEARRVATEQATLADLYKGSIGADGAVDHNGLMQKMATTGLGHMIPGYQKSVAEQDKLRAGATLESGKADEQKFKVAKMQLDASGATMNSLLADPELTHDKVISSIVGLVQNGMMTPQQGQLAVSQLPGNITALRNHLTQEGLKIMDAQKRMELLLPKFEKIDNGGSLNFGTLDQLTGKYTPTGVMDKTATPESVLNNETQRRNADLTASTQRRGQDMSAAAQIRSATVGSSGSNSAAGLERIDTPDGLAILNKRTGQIIPVTDGSGQRVMLNEKGGKGPQAESIKRQQLLMTIDEARKLLPKATASGVGALVDKGTDFFGVGTGTSEAATQLDTLAGWMTSNVPRMEGPQSDKDTAQYQIMAARVGDRTLPASSRIKALDTLEELHSKYGDIRPAPRGRSAAPPPAPGRPGGSSAPSGRTPATPTRPPLSAFEK